MRHHALSVGVLAVGCGLVASTAVAQAAAETWVSGTGSDAGTCPRTAPCRTFQFAHDQTNNNGALNVLTSGNFGPLTITKPISIVSEGVEAVINTGAGAGIIVQAGAAAVVSLRGLTIDLRGTANDGIFFVSGAALHVQDSIVRRAVIGIRFAPASGNNELHVADSIVTDTSSFGIFVNPTEVGNVEAVLNRVRVENAGSNGINFSRGEIAGSITATVSDSVTAGNVGSGLIAFGGGSGTTNVMADGIASVNNGTGLRAVGASTTIRIGDSTVTGNTTGLPTATSGSILSMRPTG